MPLTGAVKNQITAQINKVWDAITAGTAWDNPEWVHETFIFSANGVTYNVLVVPAGGPSSPRVDVQISRR